MWDPYAEFEKVTLSNGLDVHALHWPGRPWEAMGFLVMSGADQDPVGLEGLAHFVEHLVSENVGITRKDLEASFRERGGYAELGTTNFNGTHYEFFSPVSKEAMKKALDHFGRMLLFSRIENCIDRERQVILEEFHRTYNFKYELEMMWARNQAIFKGYFLERYLMPLGDPSSIERIFQPNLQGFYDRHYVPANMSVVAVGGLAIGELIELLEESPFAAGKPGVKSGIPQKVTALAKPENNRYLVDLTERRMFDRQANSAEYCSAALLPGDISQSAINIFAAMLNETLFSEIRDRLAWTYQIYFDFKDLRSFTKTMIYCQSFRSDAADRIEQEIDVCVRSQRFKKEHFERNRQSEIAKKEMYDATSMKIVNECLDDLGVCRRIVTIKEMIQDLQAVTMDDIVRITELLAPDWRWTGMVKP